MPTTTAFPGLRQVGNRRTLVFCQPTCRSAYDGPTIDVLVDVPAEQLAENARCVTCGAFLQPQYIAQCEDCGRQVYDDADGGRRHVERPEVGCFLIGPHAPDGEAVDVPRRAFTFRNSWSCDNCGQKLADHDDDAVCPRFGWAQTTATVYVRVNLATAKVDHVHLTAANVAEITEVLPYAESTVGGALTHSAFPLTAEESAAVRRVVNDDTWAPLQELPDSVEWEA